MWQGVWCRDFTDGMVLVNPPQSRGVTLNLPGTFYAVSGPPLATPAPWQAVTSVTLGSPDGIVLLSRPIARR